MLNEQTLHEKDTVGVPPFSLTLSGHGLKLNRAKTHTLQVNVGFLCNQTCRHCHLNAGPARKENMESGIVDEVVSYARRSQFETIDITGGNISRLIQEMSPLASRLMLRSNLSALNDGNIDHLFELLKSYRVIIVASFPSLNELQTDSQRGDGIFNISIDGLKKLNAIGYGHKGSGLILN
ncbi:MAG: DUF3641 domain-containing protein, partial [Deltaproteobacteria bacterium]|nr:DUF3641 domain-containing protein [Deltaproteobacteria bacterium]